MGPIYPVLMNQSTGLLPKWLLTGCLGYIGGIGQAGSAVLPFITGLISSKFGIGSLQPLCVFPLMSTAVSLTSLQYCVHDVDDDHNLGVGAQGKANRVKCPAE